MNIRQTMAIRRGTPTKIPTNVMALPRDVAALLREPTLDQSARERLERAQERSSQLEEGRCNIVPLPQVATRPFRTELTVEQASLFVANTYEGDFFVREWTAPHPDSGEAVIRRMSVGRLHPGDRTRGVLRQTHQDVFYKVLEIWGQQGYRVAEVGGKVYGTIRVSAYELVTGVFASDNARSYRRTRELLRDLMAIPVVLENVYTWQGLKDREEFSLLSDVSWSEKSLQKDDRPRAKSDSVVTIMLSALVTEGFLAKHIKVLLGQSYESLSEGPGRRSEIARLLYPFLDAQLATKDTFTARLATLSERFGLRIYDYRSKRKEKFAPALRVLDGKLIREGKYVLRVSLLASADGEDYELQARREPVRGA